jgi:7-carboxy-7-deazaguanine synthase (Cx14CxxC type)
VRYAVKELYATLQGEGAQTGRAVVLLRFAGCNLWSVREADRADAACNFCDTDFIGTDGPNGGTFDSAADLAAAAARVWDGRFGKRDRAFVVCTGGEPLLQLDAPLIEALHDAGFEIAAETNGTMEAPPGLDWICVSPKGGAALAQRSGDELKLVFPQPGVNPGRFEGLDFRHFFLQPMDGPQRVGNTRAAAAYCLDHPCWRLSLQTHKLLGLP